MFSSVRALPSPASAEGCHSLIGDERLAENSSSQEFVREVERPQSEDEARTRPPRDVEIIDLPRTDYLRHSNLHVTNKYLQATPATKRLAQAKLVDAILLGGLLSVNKSTLIQ